MIDKITLLGSSSGRNAGDAALPSGIMDSIDKLCGKNLLYEIPTIKPSFVSGTYPNRVKPISMLPWSGSLKMLGYPTFKSIMNTDLSLIFDAILFDRSLFNPLFNHLSTLYLMLPYAIKRGRKLGLYNVGVGPLTTPLGKRMMKEIADMAHFITVRDQGSYDILMDIGVTNPRIIKTADAALNVTSAPEERVLQILTRAGINPSEEILALNISAYLDSWAGHGKSSMGKARFIEVYTAAINRVLREIKSQVLFIGTQHHDIGVTKEIMARIKTERPVGFVHNKEYNHFEVKGVLSKVSLLFGMRLHALILASANCTPICGLPHQPKVTFYMQTVGLKDFNLGFDNFNEESIYQHLMRTWNERHNIRKTLEQRIPILKQEAMKGAEIVAAMDRGETVESAISQLAAAA